MQNRAYITIKYDFLSLISKVHLPIYAIIACCFLYNIPFLLLRSSIHNFPSLKLPFHNLLITLFFLFLFFVSKSSIFPICLYVCFCGWLLSSLLVACTPNVFRFWTHTRCGSGIAAFDISVGFCDHRRQMNTLCPFTVYIIVIAFWVHFYWHISVFWMLFTSIQCIYSWVSILWTEKSIKMKIPIWYSHTPATFAQKSNYDNNPAKQWTFYLKLTQIHEHRQVESWKKAWNQ